MKAKQLNIVNSSFIAIQLAFYVIILGGFATNKSVMTFLPVITAFLYSVIILAKDKRSYFLAAALLFTVISDTFLMLVRPLHQDIAMVTFSIAQLLHFARLFVDINTKKEKIVQLATRFSLWVIVEIIAVIVTKGTFDIVVFLTVFYFVNLVMNFILSSRYYKNSILLAVGFALFIGCDLVVGFSMGAGVYLDIPETSILYKLVNPTFDLTSFFYVPSQALIALSGSKFLKDGKSVFRVKKDSIP